MSEVTFKKHRVFRETDAVVFYDISVDGSNAQDLVCHTGAATSPPDDIVGAKQFYIHYHQVDHNRVLSGVRTFELVNPEWRYPYHIVHLNRSSGALVIPKMTFHRSWSGEEGSIVINQAIRDEEFDVNTEFIPVSAAQNENLYTILVMKNPLSIPSVNDLNHHQWKLIFTAVRKYQMNYPQSVGCYQEMHKELGEILDVLYPYAYSESYLDVDGDGK